METNDTNNCDAAFLNLGNTAGTSIPTGGCLGTNYFQYGAASPATNTLAMTATRCTAGGKQPNGGAALTLVLTSNYATGSDVWTGTGNYR